MTKVERLLAPALGREEDFYRFWKSSRSFTPTEIRDTLYDLTTSEIEDAVLSIDEISVESLLLKFQPYFNLLAHMQRRRKKHAYTLRSAVILLFPEPVADDLGEVARHLENYHQNEILKIQQSGCNQLTDWIIEHLSPPETKPTARLIKKGEGDYTRKVTGKTPRTEQPFLHWKSYVDEVPCPHKHRYEGSAQGCLKKRQRDLRNQI